MNILVVSNAARVGLYVFICEFLGKSQEEHKATDVLEFCCQEYQDFLTHVCEFSDVFRNVVWDMLPVSQLLYNHTTVVRTIHNHPRR